MLQLCCSTEFTKILDVLGWLDQSNRTLVFQLQQVHQGLQLLFVIVTFRVRRISMFLDVTLILVANRICATPKCVCHNLHLHPAPGCPG